MARTVADLAFAARGMYSIAQKQRDEGYMMRQRVLPIPWKEVELPKKMKIGCFIEEGSVRVGHLMLWHAYCRYCCLSLEKMALTIRQVQLVGEPFRFASINCERQDMK